ncbi:hypothetical protein [Kitasatospora sp. NPDC050463]|uniref:hypothetical protein n=1 Tax=Kitasatospora sp. NPDC050463 TaxID=3155786 RepID=UPI00341052BF
MEVVLVGVGALVFAGVVVGEVGVEVLIGLDGAEFEDGFGVPEAPAGSCHVEVDRIYSARAQRIKIG